MVFIKPKAEPLGLCLGEWGFLVIGSGHIKKMNKNISKSNYSNRKMKENGNKSKDIIWHDLPPKDE